MISGNITDNYEDDWVEGYNICFHEKDQFWPGLETEWIGIEKPILLDIGMELRGSFKMKEKSYLNKPNRPCIPDPTYSYTNCMLNFVAKMSAGHLDWIFPLEKAYPPCTTREQLLTYNKYLEYSITTPWTVLAKESGCHAKCNFKEFTFNQKKGRKRLHGNTIGPLLYFW